MKTQYLFLIFLLSATLFLSDNVLAKKECPNTSKKPQSKLICYYSKLEEVDSCYCSHVILPQNSDVKAIQKAKEDLKGIKIYVSVFEFNEGLINLLKSSKVDGLEINLRKLDSKSDISDFISTVKTKLGTDLDIVLSVPSRAELVAKYFDFKALSKNVEMFILQTAFLGASTNVTFHPSRLSGMWDMQNTDSVVDLVAGLGAPLSKLVITAPVQGFHFTLQNGEYTAPGSPALELRTINRKELCEKMKAGQNWTLERDEDQAGPYIFSKNEWIAFEDEKSIDIKAKYSRIRGLAGLALKDLSLDDVSEDCGSSILVATYNGLSRQARAPRGAVLHSLEREILETPGRTSDSVHLSPFRISRIIDTEGKIHAVRQDTRTEFHCSRQGYFVHPRSCNRFYRCVKFNQQTDDYNVFEFDCPAGLAFDEKVEVCVWPGSLPQGTPCSGSSEIAPVPKTRFECPSEPGYYADPENCRWFFACLDHGRSPLTAYEFRCPFGLAFDSERLMCEWPWLVPKCGNLGSSGGDVEYYGGFGGYNTGGQGFHGTVSPGVILQNYDGLGQLGTIKLGGLPAGTYERPISKVYSTAGTIDGYQNNNGYITGNGLGYQAVQSLHNSGLLKVNNGAALSYNTAAANDVYGQKLGGFLNLQQQQNLNRAQSLANAAAGGAYHAGAYETGQYTLDQSDVHSGNNDQSNILLTQHQAQNDLNNIALGVHSTGAQTLGANIQYNNLGGAYVNNANSYAYQQASAQNDLSNKAAGIYTSNKDYNEAQGLNEKYIQGNVHQYNTNGGAYVNNANIYAYQQAAAHNDLGNRAAGIYTSNKNYNDAQKLDGKTIQDNVQYNALGGAHFSYADAHDYQQKAGQNYFGNRGAGEYTVNYNGAHTLDTKAHNNYAADANKYLNNVNSGVTNHYASDNNRNNYAYFAQQGTDTKIYGPNQENSNVYYHDIHNVGSENNKATNAYAHAYSGESDAKSYQSITQNYGINDNVNFNNKGSLNIASNHDYNNNDNQGNAYIDINNNEFGSLKDTTAYYVNSGLQNIGTTTANIAQENNQHLAGHVNIVGGGYSAVGAHGSGVHITNNGENVNVVIPAVSLTPVTTLTSVPTVTSIPLPKTHASGFHNAGVVANIPELQYKIHANGDYGFQNVSNYASIVSSTPSPFATPTHSPVSHSYVQTYSESGGYIYSKPSIDFEEKPISVSTSGPAVSVQPVQQHVYISSTTGKPLDIEGHQGYVYNKPSVVFEETPISYSPVVISSTITPSTAQGYVYEKPATPQVFVSSTVKPAVDTVRQGYVYDKPAIRFEERPINQQVFVSTTSKPQSNVFHQGYVYEKPEIKFEETPVQPIEQQGYVYNKPSISFEEKPVIPQVYVSSTPKPTIAVQYSQHGATSYQTFNKVEQRGYQSIPDSYSDVTPKPVVRFEQKPQVFVSTTPLTPPENQGYIYNKPSVKFELPTVHHQVTQPQVVSKFSIGEAKTNSFNYQINQNINTGGYQYENKEIPAVVPTYYEPRPAVVQQPVVELYKQPQLLSTYTYQQPAIYKTEYKAPVSTYNYQNIALQSVGYAHPQEPKVQYIPSTTYRPQIVQQYQATGFGYGQANTYNTAQQSYLSSGTKCNWCNNIKAKYNYPKPTIRFEETPQKVGYEYPTPQIDFEEKPRAGYTYSKPQIKFEESPVVIKEKPSTGYSYPKPAVVFEEKPRPAVVSSFSYEAPQPTYNYVSSTTQKPSGVGYQYRKPQIPFVEQPKPFVTYENQVPIVEEPFVKKTAYVTSQTAQSYNKQGAVVENYHYQAPETYVQSTPRPTFVSTVKNIASKNLEPVTPASVYIYDSRLTPTPQPDVRFMSSTPAYIEQPKNQVVSSTSRPISKFSFSSLDNQYQYNQYQQEIKHSQHPAQVYLPVTSTDLPEKEYLPVKIRTNAPSKEYLPVEPTREYLPQRQRVKVVASTASPQVNIHSSRVVESYIAPAKAYLPERDYVPVKVTTPAREYTPAVRVTTPAREYLPAVEVTTVAREYLPATTPTKEYLPVRQRVKVTSTTRAPEITTLSREYLPARQRIRLTSTPSPVVTPVRTIIKQNDGHPLISAKLGAQCTCVSPSLNLRKNQRLVIVTTDEDYSEDNYDQNEKTSVENYSFEPEKVVEITPTPEVYIKSSTGANEYLPPARIDVRKRVRVSPVTKASEIFLRKDATPNYREGGEKPSDSEILGAVKTGLKLVKQAAREGARQGTEETLSKNFDRYGPGGLRSRSETLQGTIDCQRAGLFRHPSQCNKFYSCKWDCNKKKFTLHVFNCPVHLTFDDSLGACNWPSQGPACVENTLITGE